MLGILYFEKEVFEEAIRFFERALELDPLDTEVRVGLAIAHRAEGRTPAAVAELRSAIQTEGQSYDLLILLANLLMEQEKYDEAAEAAARAIEIDPRRLDAHYLLGLAYQQMGEDEKAREEFEKVERNAVVDTVEPGRDSISR
jgi:tetratricopeptide (TPR) repeat protein